MKKVIFLFIVFSLSFVAQAQTNGASFPFNFDDGYTIMHSNAKVEIIVHNDGSTPVSSLSYTVEDFKSGSVSNEKTATLTGNIAVGEDGKATFKIPAGSEIGVCQKIVTITKVNGVKNETSEVNASAVGNIYTLSEKMTKKTIEEEYTGTWCGWCPRGTVGMELLQENYPETFIGVAYHYSDAFYVSSNGNHEGFPACELNRHVNIDPYNGTTGNEPFGIAKDFEKEQNILPLASLTTKATWANDSKTKVDVKSDMRFVYNTDDEFRMLYIVTEDGMSGVSQNSYYSGDADYADDPYMEFWYKGGTTSTYNHVCVASFGREDGIEGSVTSPVSVGDEQTTEYTIDLSSASLIKDKSKLHLIACLLDKTTGCIINSDITSIIVDDPAGIEDVTSERVKSEECFNLSGQRVNTNAKGLIIKGGKKVIR